MGRRLGRWGAVRAIVALAAGCGALALGAIAAQPARADYNPSLTTTALVDVTVYRGDKATLKYRADDPAGGNVTIDVFIAHEDGVIVAQPVRGLQIPVGADQSWTGKISLPAGLYIYWAEATDANGLREATPASAYLRVRRMPLVPTAAALARAKTWATKRAGKVTFAVVDSRGTLHGWRATTRCTSASVVKSMLLVQYLRTHATVSAAMRDVLARMIERSDNAAADVVYNIVERKGLVHLARVTGMSGFEPRGGWITTLITAADMARFFRDMDTYIPKDHLTFADHLLASITPSQRWGIPPAAEPAGYRVFFKGGWLGANVLANQAARLVRGRVRLGLAVFTDNNPGPLYGQETITGITARLLRK
jgi:hypothetical protein